jgi:hypothetical protein
MTYLSTSRGGGGRTFQASADGVLSPIAAGRGSFKVAAVASVAIVGTILLGTMAIASMRAQPDVQLPSAPTFTTATVGDLSDRVWVLSSVVDDVGKIDVKADHNRFYGAGREGAWLYFGSKGDYWLNDTLNITAGTFTLRQTGVSMKFESRGLVGLASTGDWRSRVIKAFRKVAVSGDVASVSTSTDQLVLKQLDLTLTFDDGGPRPPDFPVKPSPSKAVTP